MEETRYKSKYITVTDVTFSKNSVFTTIIFYTNSEKKEKTIMVQAKVVSAYFLDTYKHLGINSNNVEDFLSKTDPKYKVVLKDIEKFLDYYLYDKICIASNLEDSLENYS